MGVGKFPRMAPLAHYSDPSNIKDGGNDLPTFVRSALPKIEEFVKVKFNGCPQ